MNLYTYSSASSSTKRWRFACNPREIEKHANEDASNLDDFAHAEVLEAVVGRVVAVAAGTLHLARRQKFAAQNSCIDNMAIQRDRNTHRACKPEFRCGGSWIEMKSLAKWKEMMKRRATSSGAGFSKRAAKRRT